MARLIPTVSLTALLVLLPAPAAAFRLDRATEERIDSLSESAEAVNWITLAADSPPVYVGASFRTLPYSFDTVKGAILDFDSYGEAFKYVREFLPLAVDSSRHDSSYAAYFELGTLLYRVWGVAEVRSIDTSGDGLLGIRIEQMRDSALNARWRAAPKGGIIAIGVDHFALRWYCRRIGPHETRAGFVAWLSPTIALPRWVLRFAYRAFVPRFLEDVRHRLEGKE
jgi:hypothetical protein